MKSLLTRSTRKSSRGQTLILGAFSLIFIAICLFMTLGVTWQVRNRIQLQHTAEAEAFNVATQTARMYNLFAYTNRAIVGNVVSMTILHSYHTEVGATSDIFMSAEAIYQEAAGEEMAKSFGCIWIVCFPCKNFQHCIHAAKLEIAAIAQVLIKWLNGTMGDQIQGTESKFVSAMQGIENSNRDILLFQKGLKLQLVAIGASGSRDSKTKEYNYRNADSSARAFSMALIGGGNFEKDDERRKKIEITDIINASKPVWARNRLLATAITPVLLYPAANTFLKQELDYWKFGTLLQTGLLGGGSAFYSRSPKDVLPAILDGIMGHNTESGLGQVIGSYDHMDGLVGTVNAGCTLGGVGPATPMLGLVLPATLHSGQNSSSHHQWGSFDILNPIHDGDRHKIELDDMKKSPFGFASYDFDAINDKGFKQPTMISSARVSSLSYTYDAKSKKRLPWDLKFNLKLDKDEAKVDMFNGKEAKATAKAMTYYHHPGNWKEPPNFWAPFWRAKLTRISSGDIVDLAASGATETVTVAILGN